MAKIRQLTYLLLFGASATGSTYLPPNCGIHHASIKVGCVVQVGVFSSVLTSVVVRRLRAGTPCFGLPEDGLVRWR